MQRERKDGRNENKLKAEKEAENKSDTKKAEGWRGKSKKPEKSQKKVMNM